MDVSVLGGDGSKITMRRSPDKEALTRARQIFTTGKDAAGAVVPLTKLQQPILYALCVEYGIIRSIVGRHSVSKNLISALEKHRQTLNIALTSNPQLQTSKEKTPPRLSCLNNYHRDGWKKFKKGDLLHLCELSRTEGEPTINARLTRSQLAEYLQLKHPSAGKQHYRGRVDPIPPNLNDITPTDLAKYELQLSKKAFQNWSKMPKRSLYSLCLAKCQDGDPELSYTWTRPELAEFLKG
ncbi:hypothetical protein FRC01_002103 [Tulasnella sp. 417]|nr:hypothetical protein FRC01_002103 [Tulasnella sp. 417]